MESEFFMPKTDQEGLASGKETRVGVSGEICPTLCAVNTDLKKDRLRINEYFSAEALLIGICEMLLNL